MEDPRVQSATVRIDKPQALRYAKSVAVEMSERKK
jgi:dihydroneopterin aldolase